MRAIFIDADFKCHINDNGIMTAVQTDFFDGKCDKFVEGYRYVPNGKVWTREDGKCFTGMISPWKDMRILRAYQEQYEELLGSEVAEKAAAYDILITGEML